MGARKYTYAEATWTQRLPDWIASYIRMFEHLGCVPEILTPGNLKSAIKKACRYEPEENSTYGGYGASLRVRDHRCTAVQAP